MNRKLSLLLAFLLLAALCLAGCGQQQADIGVQAGQTMPDFTVPLTDGTTATLSELLKDKDLVVLNLFASWCGPCEREFPEMEEVYLANRDRMEIVSVSAYPDDTMEIISAYKASHGLSFPMGLSGEDLSYLKIPGYPTTILIDRDGKVGFIRVGAFVDKADFESKVDYFLSADYDGKPLKSEQAANLTPYLFGASGVSALLLLIGRWGILRKAGRKGWHSLIPLLNVYDEYASVWKGWLGVLADLCFPVGIVCNILKLPVAFYYVLVAAGIVISIPESLKLAKAFGRGKLFGALMVIPGLKAILRLFLGVSRAEFRSPGSEAAA